MHILISPNAFKNSLDARSAAEAIAEGFKNSRLECSCKVFPVGDGGDGTAKLLLDASNGKSLPLKVHDPLGRWIISSIGLSKDGKTGFIEMADASGLKLLQPSEYRPLQASSYGTGELFLELLNRRVKKIVMGIGGSATVDGGVGILQALGFRFLNGEGKELTQIPSTLVDLAYIDNSKVDHRLQNSALIVLCDVNNKLLGPEGAAQIFGPQKGASTNDILTLEKALSRFREIAMKLTGRDMATVAHGGAAGGTAAGLSVFLNAELVNGIEYLLDITEFDQALSGADLVITGEGSIDEQTLEGKAPMGVAMRAKKQRIPVIALAGNIPGQDNTKFKMYFDSIVPINPPDASLTDAMKHTAANLKMTAIKLGNSMADSQVQF